MSSSSKKTSGSAKVPESTEDSAAPASLIRRVWHNLPVLGVVGFSVIAMVGITALPLRTWFQQRELSAQTEQDLGRVEAEVAELEAQYELLQTDEEIERLGRENFDLVFPGEESYRILPAPTD